MPTTERERASRLALHRPVENPSWWLLPLLLLALLVVGWGWWAADHGLNDRAERDAIARLASTRDGVAAAARAWSDDLDGITRYWAGRDEVVDVARGIGPAGTVDVPTRSDATLRRALRDQLGPFAATAGLDGFAVIGTDGTVLASSIAVAVGRPHALAADAPDELARLLAGNTVTTPVIGAGSDDAADAPVDDGPVVLSGAPVRGDGRVIGALVLRVPVDHELVQMIGERAFEGTGLVLAVDRAGDVITGSAEPAHLPERWRVPPDASWPGRGAGVHSDGDGYPVVTAWRWMGGLGFGIVVQQDRPEALAFATFAAGLLAVFAVVVCVLVSAVWLVPQVVAIRQRRERRSWLEAQAATTAAAVASERRYRSLIDPSPDAVLLVDRRGVIIDANVAAADVLGQCRVELIGQPIAVLGFDAETTLAVDDVIEQVVIDGGPAGLDRVRWDPTAGPPGWFRLRAVRDTTGADDPHVHLVLSDVSELVDHQERLAELALVDPLTGLANRLAVIRRIDAAIERVAVDGIGVAVLMVDLDRFKALNDTYGHHVGDEGIRAVARVLSGLAGSGTVGRLGGDEFVVVATDVDEAAGHELAERTGEALASVEIEVGSRSVKVLGSVGYAFTAEPISSRELMIRADRALRDAKIHRAGKVRSYASRRPGRPFSTNGTLLADLHAAVDQEQFVLRYQPIVDGSGQTCAVEALVRWTHPEHGLLLPELFLPSLLETGLLHRVGRWVVREAADQVVRWHGEGHRPVPIHVNLAPAELSYDELFDDVRDAMARVRAVGGMLCFEITEAALGPQMSPEGLAALAAIEVPIVLDDFGTGVSSLSHLRHECLAGIKLDRSFVRNISTSDHTDRSILSGTISLARDLGLDVVAEGVETEDQADWLLAQGCDHLQGWRYGAAARSEDITLPG
ncbi:MAG: EAL domain-containing protein [Actinomycetota bacterium]|nr:EAL domain-containing protein [Actinomycetota bacterium]